MTGEAAGQAWSPYVPTAERPWTLALAAHLHRRAGFGASWKELERSLAEGPARSVDRILRPEGDIEAFHREHDAREGAVGDSGSSEGIRAWWLRRMLETPFPLLETMALFWHDHFGIGVRRVGSSRMMARHVQLLRRHALGPLDELLAAVFEDPGFLVGLGAAANRRARPSDHLARVILQEHTVGAGVFSTRDVSEAARAFSGWFVLRGELREVERERDPETKTLLGKRGPFGSRDVARILAEHDATPRRIVRKLYRRFVSEVDEPSDEMLAPLVEELSKTHAIGAVVERILRSNRFFSPAACRARVKGPVELAVGLARSLEGIVSTTQLGRDLAALGQDLYAPPTVRGWAGGRAWIDGHTIVGRWNLVEALLRGDAPYGDALDPLRVARSYGRESEEEAATFLLDLLLACDRGRDGPMREELPGELRAARSGAPGDPGARLRALAAAITSLPEFQLA